MKTYWAVDRVRISADIWYKDMPDNYWGVGYEGRNTPKGEDTTAYRRLWRQLNPRIGSRDVPWGELSQLGTPFDLRG